METSILARGASERITSSRKINFRSPSEKTRLLAAKSLVSKIAYLRLGEIEGAESTAIESFMETEVPSIALREGDLICAGNEKEQLFLLRSGKATIYRRSLPGRRLSIKNIQAGCLFGEMPFLGQTMLGSEVEASEPSTVAILSRDDVDRLIGAFPELLPGLMKLIGNKLVEAERRHEQAAFQTVTARVASLLLELAGDSSLVTGLTHSEIAEILGVYRETVTVALADLKRARYIEIGRRRIEIIERDSLTSLDRL